MTNVKVVVLALLMALALTGPALGQDLDGTLKKIKSSGTFTIGYREAAPPFSFPGPDKRPVGYSIDICMHVAGAIQKQLGMENLKLAWVPVTAENRIDMVAQGKVDIECGTTTITLSRQEQVDFSLMTFVDGGGLLTTAGVNWRGVADLTDKRIAVIPGTTTEKALADFLKKEFVTVQIVKVKDHVEGLAAVEKGSADAFAGDRGTLAGIALTSKDPRKFALANVVFSYEPYGLMMQRNDPDFRLAVNRAIAGLYRSGGFIPIYERWFGMFGKPGDAILAMYLLNGLPE
ncbi:MAG TPA: amino acid ABC transporter substrate-binding protein [Candidatus Binatia bacterium]|nr:amino acid ABC transporter substrate-binding protein [Candidatus Binatia bacterium]